MVEYLHLLRTFIVVGILTNVVISNVFTMSDKDPWQDDWGTKSSESVLNSDGRFSPPPMAVLATELEYKKQDSKETFSDESPSDKSNDSNYFESWFDELPEKKSTSINYFESESKRPSTPDNIPSSSRLSHSEKRPSWGKVLHSRGPVFVSRQEIKKHSPSNIKRALNNYAENMGFGNKAANLKVLSSLCACFLRDNNDDQYKVKVPDFFCISSEVIKSALREHGKFDVDRNWRIVCKAKVENSSTPEKQSSEKKENEQLPDEDQNSSEFSQIFIEKRGNFEKDMSSAFDSILTKINQNKITFDDILYSKKKKAFFSREETVDSFNDFLAFCEKNKTKLMVRSTGKEDTNDIANAGGNYTAVGVALDPEAILNAIKDVELSYFSMKSLSQRLKLGDDTTVNGDKPLVPILLQEMVGAESLVSLDDAENRTQEVVSGVLFSRDPECGEQGGAIVTQAAFGHGEGIVNSLVSFDTYYSVFNSEQRPIDTYPIIREKIERMASVNGVDGLAKVKNAPQLARISALKPEVVSTLSKLAIFLEDAYGYPLDIEFVVKGNTIFIVQARPIVHKKHSKEPSYITHEFLAAIPGEKFDGTSIGVAGGAVRLIEDPNTIVWAQTIGQALTTYLKPEIDTGKIEAVIVGAMAPSTSHEATTFRGEGKPVLFMKEWEQLKDKFKDGKKMLFDAQQGLVCLINRDVPYDIDNDPAKGWCGYPMPRELTVLKNNDFFVSEVTSIHPLQNIGRTNGVPWSRLLNDMKLNNDDWIIKSLQQYRLQLYTFTKNFKSNVLMDDNLEDSITAVKQTAEVLSERILRSCRYKSTDSFYMQRLLPIKFLEALTYQQPNGIVVEQNSIAMLVKTMKQEPDIQDKGNLPKKSLPFYIQLTKVKEIILDDDLNDKWLRFIRRAAENEQIIQQLASFVALLEKTKILSTWLHTVFARDYESQKNPKELLVKWAVDYKKDKGFLKIITDILQRIKRVNLTSFGNEKHCDAAWRNFKNELGAFFRRMDFRPFDNQKKLYQNFLIDKMPSAGLCGKIAAVQVMREFVDIFDQSIKTVKGCPDLAEDIKLKLFKDMLQEYLQVLQDWVIFLIPELIDEKSCGLFGTGYHKNTKEAYLDLLGSIIHKESFSVEDLKPTPGVDVAVFAMGTGHDFVHERQANLQPQRAEDAFSITHQSLLNCCGVLAAAYMGENVQRPALLRAVEDMVEKLQRNQNKPVLLGVEFLPGEFLLHYNKVLENHSCQICLRYNHKERKVTINLHFCGGRKEQVYRWSNEAIFALLASNISEGLLEVQLNKLSTYEVSIGFSIKEQEEKTGFSEVQTNLISSLLNGMIDIATNDAFGDASGNSILGAVKRYPIFKNNLELLGLAEQEGIIRELGHFGQVGEDSGMLFSEFILKHFEELTEKELMVFSPGLLCCAMKNYDLCYKVIELLEAGKISNDTAILVAQRSCQSNSSIARSTALQLFNIFVSKDIAIEEASVGILACVDKNGPDGDRDAAEIKQEEFFKVLQLLKTLVQKGQGIGIIPQVMNNFNVIYSKKINKELRDIKELLENADSQDETYSEALYAINEFLT